MLHSGQQYFKNEDGTVELISAEDSKKSMQGDELV